MIRSTTYFSHFELRPKMVRKDFFSGFGNHSTFKVKIRAVMTDTHGALIWSIESLKYFPFLQKLFLKAHKPCHIVFFDALLLPSIRIRKRLIHQFRQSCWPLIHFATIHLICLLDPMLPFSRQKIIIIQPFVIFCGNFHGSNFKTSKFFNMCLNS